VLKDAATRKQIHVIQQHLVDLGKDFNRFQERMDNLAKHIHQAHSDVEEVHQSSKKISSRFNKIEKVDLEEIEVLE
jgi:DNA recombination protein RmuC